MLHTLPYWIRYVANLVNQWLVIEHVVQATVGRSNTVAMDFGRAVFGPVGGAVFAAMVAFSCFGALNGWYSLLYQGVICSYESSGASFTTARLIYVAGKEGYLPALFGRHNALLKTPLNAMCLQASLSIAFILVGGGFRSLINFAVVASWAFYFLTVSIRTCVQGIH